MKQTRFPIKGEKVPAMLRYAELAPGKTLSA
jgi:hypothetical protein